jgi:ribosomal protein L29
MKVTKFKEELKKMSAQDLKEKLDAMRRELFGLRLNSSTAHVKDYSQFNKLKKNIARAACYLRQAQAQA